jgi:ribosomal protein L29
VGIASAGVLGLARSNEPQALRQDSAEKQTLEAAVPNAGVNGAGAAADSASPRAQRVSATLTLEVKDSGAVSKTAQDVLALTRSLGGYVVSSSVTTGEQGNASLTVRVPVDQVQDAVTRLSAMGRIVSQQVDIDDLQGTLDQLEKQEAAVRAQIAKLRARLATESLDPQTEAVLRARLQTLRQELAGLRSQIAATTSDAEMSTIQLTVVTPESSGAVVPASRIDRTIDEALNVLAWEGVVALGLLIVLAPFALVAAAAWLGRRLYRRHEEERLLAT